MPIGSRTTSGTRRLAAEHVARLRCLVDELVDGAEREVGEAHLDDRARAHHGGADRGAHDAGLRDRRVGDALRPELLDEALVLAEHAAAAEVLADRPHRRVAPHLLGDRGARRLGVAHHRHGELPVVRTDGATAPPLPGGERAGVRGHRSIRLDRNPSPARLRRVGLSLRERGRALAPEREWHAIRRPPGAGRRRPGRRRRRARPADRASPSRRRRPGAFPRRPRCGRP